MNPSFLPIGLFLFLLFCVLRASETTKLFLPIGSFLASTFLIVLEKGSGIVAQLSTLFFTTGVAFVLAQLTRGCLLSSIFFFPESKTVRLFHWSAILLLSIIIVQNAINASLLLNSTEKDLIAVASPWGLFVLISAMLYSFSVPAVRNQFGQFRSGFFAIVTLSSILLVVLEVLVVARIIPGNSAKIQEGIGGVGLANLSTNETAVFACSLLLWNLAMLSPIRRGNKAAVFGLLVNLVVIFLTRSRIALILSLSLLALYVFLSDVRRSMKVALVLPLFVACAAFANEIIRQRTLAELPGGATEPVNPLASLPGSGRPVIWFFYLDAFVYTADGNLLTWLFGVGATGLIQLYELTPLQNLGLVTERIDFYPLHSDLVHIFLVSGLIGLFCWLSMLFVMYSLPKQKEYRFLSYGGLMVLTLFTVVDMLIYFPTATLLLAYAITSSLDLSTPRVSVHMRETHNENLDSMP